MAVRVQQDDFDIGAELNALSAACPGAGAVVSFTGKMRRETNGVALQSMTLEHYPGMTEAELASVEGEALDRWPLQGSLIVHRYGELHPGDNIVLVITASAHRAAAFEAAEFLMDYLKSRAPFWKKEVPANSEHGTGTWVDARETDATAAKRWSR